MLSLSDYLKSCNVWMAKGFVMQRKIIVLSSHSSSDDLLFPHFPEIHLKNYGITVIFGSVLFLLLFYFLGKEHFD